jgi:hypothetical protein
MWHLAYQRGMLCLVAAHGADAPVHLNPYAPQPLFSLTPVHLNPCAPQPLCTSTPVHLNPCAPQPLCTWTPVHLDPCAPQPLCTSTPVHLNADCTKMYALFPYDVCPLPSPMVYAVNRLQCTFYTPDDVCTMPPYDVCSIPSPHDVCSIPCRPLTMYACFMLPPTMYALCPTRRGPLCVMALTCFLVRCCFLVWWP